MAGRVENWRKKGKRLLHYYYNRAMRESGTPEYIARGWAIGMFVGFAVPFGLQLMISLPLAFLMKGSKLGAVVGTFTTNHFTIFLIYPFQCWLGNLVIGGKLSLNDISIALDDVFQHKNYESLFGLGMETLISFLLGGLILAAVSTPISYYVVKYMVIRYRAGKERKMRPGQLQNEETLHGHDSEDHGQR